MKGSYARLPVEPRERCFDGFSDSILGSTLERLSLGVTVLVDLESSAGIGTVNGSEEEWSRVNSKE